MNEIIKTDDINIPAIEWEGQGLSQRHNLHKWKNTARRGIPFTRKKESW